MENNDVLRPVSYHLRDFGQYQSLDLAASDVGNISLLGVNAVGKTTLANSWFPVLIDGSIATPSFNPARSVEAILQSTNPRNTPRDTHTFQSMLLGWGPGAYKVRTGYTYMTLASQSRKLVLGIGAHRQSDGLKSQTWWFVLESQRIDALICVDAAGHGLEREDFRGHNLGFGEELVVFKSWEEYRSFVAHHVYGFSSGSELGKLANAYRLLASPFLSGGNARFSPILFALREAQEPIDRDQIIRPLAESNRQLNQTKAMLADLETGVKRLDRIKTELFWGNLNQLAEPRDGMLNRHLKQMKLMGQAETAISAASAAIHQFETQIAMLKDNQTAAAAEVDALRQQLADQNVVETRRQSLAREIGELQKQLALYAKQQADLQQLDRAVDAAKQKLAALLDAGEQLQTEHLGKIIAQVHSQSANMTDLSNALAQTDQTQMFASFNEYVTRHQRLVKEDQHLRDAIARTSEDVVLVQGMQGEMGIAIDRRTTGMLAKSANTGLHQDNQKIHERGAAKMNVAVAALQQQRAELLQQAPDLVTFLAEPERLAALAALAKQAKPLLAALRRNETDQQVARETLKGRQAQRDQLSDSIDSQFSPAAAQAEIDHLTQERDALVIDTTLAQQLADAVTIEQQLQETANELQVKLGRAQGTLKEQQHRVLTITAELQEVDTQLEAALAVLQPYRLATADITDITALLTFERANRAEIRQHAFADVGDKVRDLIDGGADRQPLAELFAQRGATEFAAALHEQRTSMQAGLLVVPFDLGEADSLLQADIIAVIKALAERDSGQSLAFNTYLNAAVLSISQQYALIPQYNQMLSAGTDPDGIRLHVKLLPEVGNTEPAIAEALDLQASERPALQKLVGDSIAHLVADTSLADDDEAFIDRAVQLLDTRLWSRFEVTINRKNSDAEEIVDDTFVQSGGSGAEKAQAMVLPLLLVPKMRLELAAADAPHLTMFDEFADKLDPETAKAFAKTISRFGFNFIATMPSGGQTKLLADGVANRAYEVLSLERKDGKFHANQVHEVLAWHPEADDE